MYVCLSEKLSFAQFSVHSTTPQGKDIRTYARLDPEGSGDNDSTGIATQLLIVNRLLVALVLSTEKIM